MSSRARKIMNMLNHYNPPDEIQNDLSRQKSSITESIMEKENIPNKSEPNKSSNDNPSVSPIQCHESVGISQTSNYCKDNTASSSRRSSRSSSSSSSSSSCSSSCNSSTSKSSLSSHPQETQEINRQPIALNENINEASEQNQISAENHSQCSLPLVLNNEAVESLTQRGPIVNYHISPINSAESDADLSDDDPTYRSEKLSRPRWSSDLLSTNSNSFDNSVPDVMESKNITRKRKSDPSKWKQNVQKIKRNLGEKYTSVSSNKEVSARELKPPCTLKCRLKCSEKIDYNKRLNYFKSFWALGNLQLQRMFIQSCMVTVTPKYKYTNAENPRQPNNAYYLNTDEEKIKVCKTFFMNTLGITAKMIRTVREKSRSDGFVVEDNRGKHKNHKTVSESLKSDIKDFINTIPRIESHYLRASTTREYISGGKTITDLFRDFEVQQKQKGREAGRFHTFYEVFTTQFNIGFFQPKKDQCDLCLQYRNSTEDQRRDLKEKYDIHLEEKELSRVEKKIDRNNIDECHLYVCYDVQAIMQSPNGDTSSFYYKSKLNSYNFTMTELEKLRESVSDDDFKSYGDVHCYFWDETQAKRGAIEIGSCVLDYLRRVSEQAADRELHVTFLSDNCCGRNKNKYMAALYMFAVTNISNLMSVTHKYLIKGHTYNEADNVHSLIQKQIARDLKAGPIYTPLQYMAAIQRARKTGKPFIIHALTYDFFYDIKDLQEKWGYNFILDEQKNTVVWNDIKMMKFTKENPFSFWYKTSYKGEYIKINVRNKRKKMLEESEISLQKAYNAPFELSSSKKKDLKELISKKLIDSYHATYFETMLL